MGTWFIWNRGGRSLVYYMFDPEPTLYHGKYEIDYLSENFILLAIL